MFGTYRNKMGPVGGRKAWLAGLLVTASLAAGAARGADPVVVETGERSASADRSDSEEAKVDPAVVQAACKSCGTGGHGDGFIGCGNGACYPGRRCKSECHDDSFFGRLFGGFYDCLCCPDPCYEPRWIGVANSAFFVDDARPITHMRLRADWGFGMLFPDRAEYFQARAGVNQVDEAGNNQPAIGKGPGFAERELNYRVFSHYAEMASGNFGMFIETTYRNVDPETDGNPGAAGFGDLGVGSKNMLIDCELMQLTFQMKTYIPVGVAAKGLGTGHLSLEPSLLTAIRLAPDTYFQGQASYWIPIAGDPTFAGDIFHYHLSLNQVICYFMADVYLVATLEFNGWAVLDGAYTDPAIRNGDDFIAQDARDTLLSAGGGLRLIICDKLDVGGAAAFAITDDHWADELYRLEIRWRN